MSRHGTRLFVLLTLVALSPLAGCAPQATALTAPAPGTLGNQQAADLVVRLFSTPTPPVRGLDVLEAVITDVKGQPVTDARVSFDLDMTTMSHGKYVVKAAPQAGGRYAGQVRFMMPGPWRVIAIIERPGHPIEQMRFDFNVNLR